MRRFLIIVSVFAVVLIGTHIASGDNINSRFTDSDMTYKTVRTTNLYKGGVSITSSAAEINLLDGSSAGTAVASKAVVLGSDKDIDSLFVKGFRYYTPITQVSASRTLSTSESGRLFYARPISAKDTLTLPGAAAGLTYDVMVADSDSLVVTTASGDSLVFSTGAAYKTTTSVAGTAKIVAIDATRWLVLHTLGTWTSY